MDKHEVYSYTTLDDKVFKYNFETEEEMQKIVTSFPDEVFFYLSHGEYQAYFTTEPEQVDNLKEDFIWFRPGVNKLHVMECTCGAFLESGTDMDKLAKLAVRHSRKTGHQLNPRGN